MMSFVLGLGAWEIHSVEISVKSWLGRRQPFLSLPLLVADRRFGYVFVLVWFRLGILGLILISVLNGIPDRLSSDLISGTSMKGNVCIAGRGGCLLPVN
jgi:hypothetical protein